MHTRSFDVVLYGASGFVGRLAAQYLAATAATSQLRWAIAGRDRSRLEQVAQLTGGSPEVLVGGSTDTAALDGLAQSTRVLLNTAGPFALYASAVVDACVRCGTHYVDITGETAWVRSLIALHHERAAEAGTRIIPFCGFDSVPSDLGSLLLVRQMQRSLGVGCRQIKAYFRMSGGLNGGTVASDAARREAGNTELYRDLYLLNPVNAPAQTGAALELEPVRVEYDRDVRAWVGPFIMAQVNTRVVRRSAALFRDYGEAYGEDFRYQEYARYPGALGRAKAHLVSGLLAGFDRAMSLAATRAVLKQVLPRPGQGPSLKTMDQGWFDCVLVGTAEDGRQLRGVIRQRGDPGNRATVEFVCESALALALDADELPGGVTRGGVLTPATGLGLVLAERLRRAGTSIEIADTAD